MQYFGEKLRALRKERGWSQKELAGRLGLVAASVSAYEQDKKVPSVEILIKICSVFQVSADYLLGLSDDMRMMRAELTDEQMALLRQLIRELERGNRESLPSD